MRHSEASNQSLSKGLAILEQLGDAREELGVRELARRLDLSPSVVQRLVSTLRSFGFVEQNASSLRYRIGHRIFEVGQTYLAQQILTEHAFTELRELAHAQSMSAFLGVLRGYSVIYLLSLTSGPVTVNTQPGSRTHLHSTALGKMLLAGLPEAELAVMLDCIPLPRLTPTTIVDRDALLEEVREARCNGFALSDEENIPGLYSVGAGIADRHGTIAAISLSAPCALITEAKKREMRDGVEAAARRLSRRMGARAANSFAA